MSEKLKNDQEQKQTTDLSSFIWKIADNLWGDFKHTDFPRIILPFLLLRRLECVLEPTKDEVLAVYDAQKDSGIDMDLLLPEISGFSYYNTSQFTLGTLGSTSTAANLVDYMNHYSTTVRTIFEEFKFEGTVEELKKANLLYMVVKDFAGLDLHPDVVSDRVMSNSYEDLIRKFAESVNAKAGEFMSPRDMVRLSTQLVLHADEEIFYDSGVIRSVYDQTAGTLGFVTEAIDQIHEFNPSATVVPYGQEIDPETHAMALTSMLIRKYNPDHIKRGDTLADDKFAGKRFHYCLSNPPFGIKWEKSKKQVLAEHELGFAGRFGAGTPNIGDGAMLFLQNLVAKMELPENGGGRAAIILAGSPLFNGKAASGESEIRRWLLEQDLVETIVECPTDMFFNTGISTYIWVLSNHKEEKRKGKVQLINASDKEFWTPMRKSEGSKRRYINEDQIKSIVAIYDEFEDTKVSKIFDSTEFAYRNVTIQRPLRAKVVIDAESIESLSELKAFAKLKDEQQKAWADYLSEHQGEHDYHWFSEAVKQNNNQEGFGKCGAPLAKALTGHFMVRDEACDIIKDNKGNIVFDSQLKDVESIPYNKDIQEYFEEEVLPHVPDALIDESVVDEKDGETGIVGYEINFNRYFYEYVPPRSLADIDADLKASEVRIQALLQEVIE